jgi:hypothetical protein
LKKEAPAAGTAKKPVRKAATEPLVEDTNTDKPQTEKKKKKAKYVEPENDDSGSDA